jgi:hypothetical protein
MPALTRTAPNGMGLPKVALFTTYQLRTGSQFPKMRRALKGKTPDPILELKSKGGKLSDADRKHLNEFVA